jgi:LacI family transcriptional regulator
VTGATLATQHLIALGHRRIGHLAGQTTVSTGVLRRKGYHAALGEAGIQADADLVVESGFVEEGGGQATDRLLSLGDPPSAIFAVTDMTAVGAYGAARKRGLRIPEDLAIVGYNDIPLAGRLIPGLTTVHVPIHEFGSVAARMLLEQIETGMLTPRRVVFAPQLVVRGSSVAGADELPMARPAQRSPAE